MKKMKMHEGEERAKSSGRTENSLHFFQCVAEELKKVCTLQLEEDPRDKQRHEKRKMQMQLRTEKALN